MSPGWDEVMQLVRARASSAAILAKLKPHRHAEVPVSDLREIALLLWSKDIKFNATHGFSRAMSPFDPTAFTSGHRTFMEFFTRRLTAGKLESARRSGGSARIVLPNECNVESVGTVGDLSSIIRLKRPAPDAMRDLLALGVPEGYSFVNMKLQLTYYHHVHVPVDGHVARIVPVPAEQNFFGRNSLSLVEFKTEKAPVFLLVVGEFVIQDFRFAVEVGQRVERLDRLGNFDWGSQTVLLFPANEFGGRVRVASRQYHFVGAPVA